MTALGRCLPQDEFFTFQNIGFEEIDTLVLTKICFPVLEAIFLYFLSSSQAKETSKTKKALTFDYSINAVRRKGKV